MGGCPVLRMKKRGDGMQRDLWKNTAEALTRHYLSRIARYGGLKGLNSV